MEPIYPPGLGFLGECRSNETKRLFLKSNYTLPGQGIIRNRSEVCCHNLRIK